MILREIFAAIGMDTDAASFAEATLAVDGVRAGFNLMKDAAMKAIGVITETAGSADAIDEAAASAGIAAGTLQELSYAASFAGMGMSELKQSMAIMARKGVKDVAGAFNVAADRVKALVDQGRGAEAVAYAMEQFGRAGARMVPMLKDGAAGLEKLKNEAHEVGYVLGDDAIKAGVLFSDSLDKMKLAGEGLRNTIGAELIPMVQPYLDMLLEWSRANRAVLRANIQKALIGIGRALVVVGKVLKTAWKLWSAFSDAIGGTEKALGVLATIWLATKLPALFTALGTHIAAAGAKLVAFGNMGLLGGAKAALGAMLPIAGWLLLAALIVLAAEDLKTFFEGGDSYIGDFISGPWKDFNKAVEGTMAEISKSFTDTWTSIKTFVSSTIDAIVNKIVSLGVTMRDTLAKVPGLGNAMEFYFGKSAATPQASVASSPRAAGMSTQSTQNTFQASFVNNGADPTATAAAQKETFAEWLNNEFKASTPAVKR